jgi:hypothetical protein
MRYPPQLLDHPDPKVVVFLTPARKA